MKQNQQRKITIALVSFMTFLSLNCHASWIVKTQLDSGKETLLSVTPSQIKSDSKIKILQSLPAYLSEDDSLSSSQYVEKLFSNEALPNQYLQFFFKSSLNPTGSVFSSAEVRTLVTQGPSTNRINITILGDGYTLAEKNIFFEDAQRMTDGLFKDKAFSSYLPLFNVVAIFVPSNQSGLTDLNSVDTAFGLYRSPAGSKRGILPGKPDIIRAALTLSPSNTDYPIVIANDNSYGGLGGEFAITTRSIESGLMVLRHELGHNFGQVGEEYDGGQVYQGANNSLDGTNPSWNHWISGPVTTSESKLLAGEYLWKNLSGGNISIDFNFPTQIKIQPYLFYALLSTVGWSSPNDVKVFLDGNPIQPEGIFTEDRSFFAIDLRQSLKSGHHTLEFHENLNDGNNIIASARVYALPFDYDFSNTIGAVSVFDVNGFPSGYRPTHNSCIMQNMRSFEFCSIDKENMWVQFLNRVNTIDAVNTTKDIPNKIATVELLTPDLSNLKIRWFRVDRNGKANEILGIKNKRTWTTYPEDKNLYRVEVKLVSPEVLKPSTRFTSTKDFKI